MKSVRIVIFGKEDNEIIDIFEFTEEQLYTPSGKMRAHPLGCLMLHMGDVMEGNRVIEIVGVD